MRGTVVSIYMEDFMTYSKVRVTPRGQLNVIVGANGTGKSTIVCALVLGLGGKPSILGRASKLTSFIKFNRNIAKIEIELCNPDGDNYVITRIITQDGRSSWQLNGVTANQKQVDDLVRSLNIQVDNLLQFLPQDRVADFAKMNAQQRLESTEKCIGTPEMIKQHEELKQLRAEFLELENQTNDMSTKLQDEEQRIRRLQIDVDNIAAKERFLEAVMSAKQKLAWVKYKNVRALLDEQTKDRREVVKLVKHYEEKCKPMEKQVADAEAKILEMEKRLNNVSPKDRKQNAQLCELENQVEMTERQIKANISDYNNKMQEEVTRQNNVKELMKQINKLENDLKDGEETGLEELEAALANNMVQQKEKHALLNNFRRECERRQLDLEKIYQLIRETEADKKAIEDAVDKKLQIIKHRRRGVYEAVLWLRQNKGRFRKKIYEPMMLEMNVKPQFANYVECLVSSRDLYAFTCEDKADMNEFVQITNELNMKISAVHSGDEHRALSSYTPAVPMSQLRQYGFHTFLLNTIEAPETILKFLCMMYSIHNVPVGIEPRDDVTNSIPDIVNRYFYETKFMVKRKSKYTQDVSVRSSEVGQSVILSIRVDTEKLQEIDRRSCSWKNDAEKLKNELVELQQGLNRCEREIEVLRSEKKKISDRRLAQQNIQARLRLRRNELMNLESSKVDPEELKRKCSSVTEKLTKAKLNITAELIKLMKICERTRNENAIQSHELESLREKKNKIENMLQELRHKCETAKETLRSMEVNLDRLKNDCKTKLEEAKKLTDGIAINDPKFAKFRNLFDAISDSEEELQREIDQNQARADCLGETDENTVQEYEKQKRSIAKLKGSVEERTKRIEILKNRMNALRDEWLPTLRDLVSRISNKYGECFARLNCVGEVNLSTDGSEDDYDKYGIKIKVKFRDGDQLQELTQYLQSGGERAVATAIYMIALQELTRVPFCCVDEINQGMDSVNERLIFELLVTTTSLSETAQYFLLTPKLLEGLPYDDSVCMLQVLNGITQSSICGHTALQNSLRRVRRMHK